MKFRTRGQLTGFANAALRQFRTRLVIYMHSLGFTDHQMAEALDVSVRTIGSYRRAAGLPVNRKKWERRDPNKNSQQHRDFSLRRPSWEALLFGHQAHGLIDAILAGKEQDDEELDSKQ